MATHIIFVLLIASLYGLHTKAQPKAQLLASLSNSTTNDGGKLRLNKCCPFGASYNATARKCQNTTEQFNPEVWRYYQRDEKAKPLVLFYFENAKPTCIKGKEYLIRLTDAYKMGHYLNADGNLYINVNESIPPWIIVKPNKYCLDSFTTVDGSIIVYDALMCYVPPPEPNYVVSSSCMLISCAFIIITVAVYTILPNLRSTVPGKILISYLVSQFVGFLLLGLMQILIKIKGVSQDLFLVIAFIIYFSVLTAFFWLNVLCYDTWKTLTSSSRNVLTKRDIMARFYKYAIYAYGVPAIFTIIMIALEFSDLPPHPYLPLIRLQGNFLYGKSRMLYLYGPLIIICVANLVFFVLTAWKLIEHKRKTTSVLRGEDSSRNDQRNVALESFIICLKLFAIMGISWFLEVISSLYPELQDTVWNFTDGYNFLIGFIIFVIFVCKKAIFKQLIDRYQEIRSEPKSHSTSTSRTALYGKEDIKLNTSNSIGKEEEDIKDSNTKEEITVEV